MIPDRIYINGFSAFATEPVKNGIEYIRKDALIEWAKEHYTSLDITKRDMWDGGYNCAIKELIDKLNSM